MYVVGTPILVMHGSFVGGAVKIPLTKAMVLNSLTTQTKIKVFSELEDAKKYATSLREEAAVFTNPKHRRKVVPVFTIDLKDTVSTKKTHEETIQFQQSVYSNDEIQEVVQYFYIKTQDIYKIHNAQIFNEEYPMFVFSKDNTRKCTIV